MPDAVMPVPDSTPDVRPRTVPPANVAVATGVDASRNIRMRTRANRHDVSRWTMHRSTCDPTKTPPAPHSLNRIFVRGGGNRVGRIGLRANRGIHGAQRASKT